MKASHGVPNSTNTKLVIEKPLRAGDDGNSLVSWCQILPSKVQEQVRERGIGNHCVVFARDPKSPMTLSIGRPQFSEPEWTIGGTMAKDTANLVKSRALNGKELRSDPDKNIQKNRSPIWRESLRIK